jgi:hypothetical protein
MAPYPHRCTYARGRRFSGISLAHRQAIAGARSARFIPSESCHAAPCREAGSRCRWVQRDRLGGIGVTSWIFP